MLFYYSLLINFHAILGPIAGVLIWSPFTVDSFKHSQQHSYNLILWVLSEIEGIYCP